MKGQPAITYPEEVKKILNANHEEFSLRLVVTPLGNKQASGKLCAAQLSVADLMTYCKEEGC